MAKGGKKDWVEILLMPVIIALVGVLGTYLITGQQAKNVTTLAKADREIKIIEIFAEKITSANIKERRTALRLLKEIDEDLAARLAGAVSEDTSETSEVRKFAQQIAEEAAAVRSGIPRIYIHIQSAADRDSAKVIEANLVQSGYLVPGIERLVNVGPKASQLRFFRREEQGEAEEIATVLKDFTGNIDTKYITGYEDSRSVRPHHFELWLAASAN